MDEHRHRRYRRGCVVFRCYTSWCHMKTAESVRRGTRSSAKCAMQLAFFSFLATSCGGKADTTGNDSVCALDGSVPAPPLDTCSVDADCMMCPIPTAPTYSCQCDSIRVSCCPGLLLVPLTQERCNANQTAWSLFCPEQPNCYPPPTCPMPPTCSAVCVNGACSGSCGFP